MKIIHDDVNQIDYCRAVKEIAIKKKPDVREKLLKMGSESLCTQELMMLILGSGSEKVPVRKLAKNVLDVLKSSPNELITTKLLAIDGIGESKSCLISASLELGKRFHSGQGSRIVKPIDIIPFIHYVTLEKRENFLCVSLNGAHDIVSIRTISVGTLNRCLIHPREVFADALKERAAAIIIAHNHPSGNTEPSQNDIDITQQLYDVSKILGIHLLDHVIICAMDYYSFAENGLIFT